MKKETKDALYSLLDLMDMLGSIDFIKVDIDRANRIRKEVLDVIGDKKEVTILDSSTDELLGVLPVILLDSKKFPSTKEILKFAEKCLNIKIKNYWQKRSRAEVVGIIINEVYEQRPAQFNNFLKAWNEFSNETNHQNMNAKQNVENIGFMDAWFQFFDSYKGVE